MDFHVLFALKGAHMDRITLKRRKAREKCKKEQTWIKLTRGRDKATEIRNLQFVDILISKLCNFVL